MMDWLHLLDHDASAPWTFPIRGSVFLVGVLPVDGLWNRDRQRALRHGWLLPPVCCSLEDLGWFVGILVFSTFSDHLIGHRIARSDSDRAETHGSP